ncbi:D-glucuronyl C5-epimerase family protein [Aneurinibacillus sp. REN35]|uniref:D-glucuronyl C5-epimerase family protein n=1 Tax=Aneurinibacillus sp. REN35 TaxID=3237286 RepID=UPI003528C8AA
MILSKKVKFYSLMFFIFIFIFTISPRCTLGIQNNSKFDRAQELVLPQFYKQNFYRIIFGSKDNGDGVNPYVEPKMGWKTEGKSVANPTKVAMDGLILALDNNITAAEKHAQWLLANSKQVDRALFFPFNFDFAPYYPYSLKAPWNSALTQGISLELFSYLYEKTGSLKYRNAADKIFLSYKVPLEYGGFTRFEKEGPFFEEYPTKVPSRVLNGALVSMLALHDYSIITNNPEAEILFQNSVRRFEPLLKDYDTKISPLNYPASSYSLAPVRTEIIGRFIGEGVASVYGIKLIGKNGDNEKTISEVAVGTKEDDNINHNFYIWPDTINMNWGSRINSVSDHYRIINGVKGQLNHSPFKFVWLAETKKFKETYIEVTYKMKEQGKLDIHLYDENEYWLLGSLNYSPSIKKVRFKIKEEFISSFLSKKKSESAVDEKYLDDNQILVELIGKVTNSSEFLTYAERWKNSKKLVPAKWLNELPPNIFKNEIRNPIVSISPQSEGSKHVEYPSVIKIDGIYYLYYCAYGEDMRWRIHLATSSDGIKWVKQGRIFNEGNLPFQGNYSFPFVMENKQTKNPSKRYLMYFSAGKYFAKPYDRLYLAYSPDGIKWKVEKQVLEDMILDPFIIQEQGLLEMYYSTIVENQIIIKRRTSKDGEEWTDSSSLVVKNILQGDGYYTIGGVKIKESNILFIEGNNKNQHYIDMYKISGEEIIPYKNNPIYIDRDWTKEWNAIHYGLNIVQDNNKYLIFYNGISQLGVEGGQIGKAELNSQLIEQYLEDY